MKEAYVSLLANIDIQIYLGFFKLTQKIGKGKRKRNGYLEKLTCRLTVKPAFSLLNFVAAVISDSIFQNSLELRNLRNNYSDKLQ